MVDVIDLKKEMTLRHYFQKPSDGDAEPIAVCDCGCHHWYVLVNGHDFEYDAVCGIQCVNPKCRKKITWFDESQKTSGKENNK